MIIDYLGFTILGYLRFNDKIRTVIICGNIMSLEKIPEKVESPSLPQIAPNWGERTVRSAEAKALRTGSPDKEDLQRARIVDRTKERITLEDSATGKSYNLTPEQYKTIMEAA